jgi:aryl-alcohol dehydrogenase-like predicted oxidoreductase
MTQFALKYCLAYDEVTTVIPGVASMDQLLMNIEALKYPLDKKILMWLETFYEQKV